MGHSKLAPSWSKTWMTCTAAPNFCEKLGLKSESSSYANLGTAVHALIEQCLKNNRCPTDYIGTEICNYEVTSDMVEDATIMVNFVRNLCDEYRKHGFEYECSSEIYADLTFLGIDGMEGGTVDCCIYAPELGLHIIDYKNGSVYVDEVCNSQLMIYAVAMIEKYKICSGSVELSIVQPNAGGDVIRTYSTTVADVNAWKYKVLIPKAKETLSDGTFCPSESACKWCPAHGDCAHLRDKLQSDAMIEFAGEADVLPSLYTLTAEQKSKIVEFGDQIKTFVDNVRQHVTNELLDGSHDYKGSLKLVRKNTKRRFTDAAGDPIMSPLFDVLTADEIYKKSMKPISEIEKLLKKKLDKEQFEEIMSEIVEKPLGEIEVALSSDKRVEVNLSEIENKR